MHVLEYLYNYQLPKSPSLSEMPIPLLVTGSRPGLCLSFRIFFLKKNMIQL
jgi:hypothetical protein